MSSLRVLSAALALGLALAACQSAEKKAAMDEVKVARGVEAVCAAQADVDDAVVAVKALTAESTVAEAEKAGEKLNNALSELNKAEDQLVKAEVKEYRDQVEIFRQAVNETKSGPRRPYSHLIHRVCTAMIQEPAPRSMRPCGVR